MGIKAVTRRTAGFGLNHKFILFSVSSSFFHLFFKGILLLF
jgi:hypothetical protein